MAFQLFFAYWLLNIVVQSINVVRVNLLNKLNPAKSTKYPSYDLLLDNAVIVRA